MFLRIYLSSTLSYPISSSLHLCSFLLLFFLIFPFLFFIFRPYFAFPYPLFCFSSLLLFFNSLPFSFNLDTLKRYPSKRASLINIVSTSMVYSRPCFIPGLFYFTYFPLYFFFSYTYSSLPILCSYFTLKISNFPVSLERKLNLMAATCPRKDFDPKREFVFLPCMSARQPSSRT